MGGSRAAAIDWRDRRMHARAPVGDFPTQLSNLNVALKLTNSVVRPNFECEPPRISRGVGF